VANENKLIVQRERGVKAEQFMSSAIVQEALKVMEQKIKLGWENSKADDHEARHNAYLMNRLLKNFKSEFLRAMKTGKVAEKDLLRIKEKSKLRRLING
jgi:hypothetical protein